MLARVMALLAVELATVADAPSQAVAAVTHMLVAVEDTRSAVVAVDSTAAVVVAASMAAAVVDTVAAVDTGKITVERFTGNGWRFCQPFFLLSASPNSLALAHLRSVSGTRPEMLSAKST
jgi:hypothetical protein